MKDFLHYPLFSSKTNQGHRSAVKKVTLEVIYDVVDERTQKIKDRLGKFEERMDHLENKIDSRFEHLNTRIDQLFALIVNQRDE